ncbi:MAG: DUF2264 domain-containing protein [Treponema sp.]|jgi:hypothetical protein|nr:DUF2264 domain-containing protein [Treponema sp.]
MKPFDHPLGRNPLLSRGDVERSLVELLAPLEDHALPGGYYLGSAAARYSPKIALMEGWSRTLWGIGPLIAGGGEYPGLDRVLAILKQGINPKDPGWWGIPLDKDQRLVEMAAIALSLIIARNRFWESLDKTEQEQLYTWLAAIEGRELPDTNWHFFRILVCTAFRKLGLPVDEGAEKESFDRIEACYVGDGWYQDGIGGTYDFYNPFGFHFYGLVYAGLAADQDRSRAAIYVERARLFAPRFAAWFREDGSIVPYGRSLTYRFAAASFFSACAFAGIEALPWGLMKGLLLRNLRWWFSRPILDNGGILSTGYGYPNLIMADTYNSPGSPYWGLKAYLVLALGEDHPFWRAGERPLSDLFAASTGAGASGLPVNRATGADPADRALIMAEKIPGFILSRSPEDVQLLVPGQYPGFDMAHAAEKYCKFAYSARFGFCVSHSNYNIEMTGCDSMLLLTEDGYWRQRRQVRTLGSGENWTASIWEPWVDVRITTFLVSLGTWHVRLHRIESGRTLRTVEGGFPVKRYAEFGEAPPAGNAAAVPREALAAFDWGASRIAALEDGSRRQGAVVIPGPNLNILYPSVAVPVLEGTLEPGLTVWAAGVRAGDPAAVLSEGRPSLRVLDNNRVEVFDARGIKAAELSLGN